MFDSSNGDRIVIEIIYIPMFTKFDFASRYKHKYTLPSGVHSFFEAFIKINVYIMIQTTNLIHSIILLFQLKSTGY